MIRYCNRRLLVVLLMGFASGLPIVLIGSTLQAWFTMSGISIVTIGTLSLVGQPYVYKFLWAPLMDRFSPWGLGRRRGWIVSLQVVLVASLVVLSYMHPLHHPFAVALLALMIATFSASQDIAIDAYRTDILEDDERGMGAAMVTIGYRAAMLVAGAIGLILAAKLGWHYMYLIMAGVLLLEVFVTLWSPTPKTENLQPLSMKKAVIEPWRDLLSRDYAIAILIFIVIYNISDAFAIALNTPFLLRSMHFSLEQVGAVSKVAGLGGALIGGFVGGFLVPMFGLYRSLLFFGFLQMASNLMYLWMTLVPKSLLLMGVSMFSEYFCTGLASVAFVAFLMGLCNKRYTATQYALLTALMAIGRVFVGPLAGLMVEHIGWTDYYALSFLIGVPSLILLFWMNTKSNVLFIK
jgi:MFS transporter, PAT family, beta-lactamase induction signal transducer AmpG